MHTVKVIAAGLVLLGIFWGLGRWLSLSAGTWAAQFLLVWLACAGFNMWMGVSRAGYSVSEELPYFAVVFLVPSVPALLIWRKTR
ncbi:hypothetical protein J2X04_002171 [Lysobacter niabensis]|uniref:Uncharacterized protein n=1 Tax=Agrilutibacter niabensis TaxID=380628 RepID=A0ABU1VQL7_9GAMM|nr:hypothetical protein [Lysobacter niabensis]MDR7099790.1 hypothetical protein [Lysobacter niabensis]